MSNETINGYEGIYSMETLRENIKSHSSIHASLEYVLYEPFAEWLSLYNVIEGLGYLPYNFPSATFITANATHATYILSGTSPRTLEENGHVSTTHTRERIVRFPLDFIENKAPYEEAARKALEERMAKQKAETRTVAEARLAALEAEKEELQKLLNQ